MNPTVYLESLGCRLNAAELEELARRFDGAGCVVVHTPTQADVIVLNSCAVTVQAASKSRRRLRTLHRRSPQAQIAVLGCWATEDLAAAQALPGVAWVIPNTDKARAVELIAAGIFPGSPTESPPLAPWAPGRWGHTRAFLGVQDGCDHTCTYCITRILRGEARSRPLDEVVAVIQDLVAQQAREVVLTGVSLGAYGLDLGLDGGLATLVAAILARTSLPRLRLSSVEPWDVDARLLRFLADPRFCRQLHLPLQSGSDAVLRRMGRRCTTETFASLVAAARVIAPDVAITTDMITGFPGETEHDFTQTLAFVERIAFARLHVFPYSEREGTAATRLPGRVPERVRTERASRMRALGHDLSAAYAAEAVGQTLPVLWERQDDLGRWRGLTDTYIEVRAASDRDLYNCIVPTRLLAVEETWLRGEVVFD